MVACGTFPRNALMAARPSNPGAPPGIRTVRQIERTAVAARPAGLGSARRAGDRVRRSERGSVAARSASASADVRERKKDLLLRFAGSNKGFDLTEKQMESIMGIVKELEAMNPTANPAATDLTGTKWATVLTTSKGASSGKIGPFIATTDQIFPGDTPGEYINTLELGPLQGYLRAVYERAEGRLIRVEFIEQEFSLGPFRLLQQKFEPRARVGTWRMVYQDEDLRVLYTNLGSLFVLSKKAE